MHCVRLLCFGSYKDIATVLLSPVLQPCEVCFVRQVFLCPYGTKEKHLLIHTVVRLVKE